MHIHVNRIKGDIIFYEWEDGSYEQVEAKQKELEDLGYKLIKKDGDFLNDYFYYQHSNGDTKLLTFCRC